ncbi:MAG: MupA/Atu3671 family FMN-dependent luciferase-like monooxygenase [Bacteroidota bacterium]
MNHQQAPSNTMEFSLFYFAAEEDVTRQNKYELLLEGAKFADQNGLSAVWVPERHFHQVGDPYPNPSVAAAAVATITKNIKLRSGSLVLPLHDPIRAAEEWSMVDNLSNGRAEVSIASGWNPNDFIYAPEDYENRHYVMRDKIEIFRNLWQGGHCTRTNGKGEDFNVYLHPKPIQKDIPVWLTSVGSPETFRYAGAIGANILTNVLAQDVDQMAETIKIYRTARLQHGHDPATGKVALMMHCFLGESMEYVQKFAKEPFKNYLRHSIKLTRNIAAETGLDMKRNIDQLVELAANQFFYTSGIFGRPEDCIPFIKKVYQMGVDEIACLIDFGIDYKVTIDHLPNLVQLKELVQKTDLGKPWMPQVSSEDFSEIDEEELDQSAEIFENNLDLFNN